MNVSRVILFSIIILISFLLVCSEEKKFNKMSESEKVAYAESIHKRILKLDAHLDIEVTFFTPEKEGAAGYYKFASLKKMNEGYLSGAFFIAYNLQGPLTPEGYETAYNDVIGKIKTIHKVAQNILSDSVGLAFHPEDVSTIYKSGKKIAIIAIENGYPIGNDIERLKEFYNLGVRYITLSHIRHNQICDSNMNPDGPESIYGGLSPFGEKVISEMNKLGIIIDISHISRQSVLEVLRKSKAPVIASHTAIQRVGGVGNVWDDEQLDALKENNGVIHIVGLKRAIEPIPAEKTKEINNLRKEFNFPIEFWPFFLAFDKAPEDRRSAYLERLENINKKYPIADVKYMVDHIEYVIKRIGVYHVGISSDFYDHSYCLTDWRDASQTFNITFELLKRGYTAREIEKIWSGNTLRVWREVEGVAAKLQME